MASVMGDFQVTYQTGILAEEEQQCVSVATCKWVCPIQGLQGSQKRKGLFPGQHMIATLWWGTATDMK
jgi:Fe-S-cluster-containing hydrogenase component 2